MKFTQQNPCKIGIIATGKIAHKFARDVQKSSRAVIHGVGSRELSRAREFAEELHVEKAYGSYQELADDPDVDIVYIATPHNLHYHNTIMSLEAGKHVLCEKPFAINAKEAKDMVFLAREKKLFLMEAMWARFNPAISKLRELLAKQVIGELSSMKADFSFYAVYNPAHRLFNPELSGGALLDVGVYTISLASMIFGTPATVQSAWMPAPYQVDFQNAVLLGYDKGMYAQLSSGFVATGDREAWVYGRRGRIKLSDGFHRALYLTVFPAESDIYTIEFLPHQNGLDNQLEHMIDCLNRDKIESDIMPLDESISIMETMDELRAQWGLSYPGEDE